MPLKTNYVTMSDSQKSVKLIKNSLATIVSYIYTIKRKLANTNYFGIKIVQGREWFPAEHRALPFELAPLQYITPKQ